MSIQYWKPLSGAWNRMLKKLFRPFDINKWIYFGFTSFLAGLMDSRSGGPSYNFGKKDTDIEKFLEFPESASEWMGNHPDLTALIFTGALLALALLVVLTWLSSRGKFMFLDNVVRDRLEVAKPWRQFKTPGNSLFVWRLCFGFLCILILIPLVIMGFLKIHSIYQSGMSFFEFLPPIIGIIFLFVILTIILGYISLFLNDFIVPIMYKHRISANQAWGRFWLLFQKDWLHFILYGIAIFLLYMVIAAAVVAAGLMTCCIGFFLLIVPYIGSVVLLPVSYTLRVFSLEFLRQFDKKYALFR